MVFDEQHATFYRSVLLELLDSNVLTLDSHILVVCGGTVDRKVLLSLGFTDVTISNLDERMEERDVSLYAPYAWDYQDLEDLRYADQSFELVLVHSGLHHLACPQKGIQEMYRVASKGILAFEPYLSLLTRLGSRLGLGQVYEDAAVFDNDFKYGGVANTEIPNYVYRFTHAEIVKTVQTMAPITDHECRFWYATRVPGRIFRLKERRVLPRLVKALSGILVALGSTFPAFANNVAFYVRKPKLPDELFPWLAMEDGVIHVNREFLTKKYEGSASGPDKKRK